MKEKLICIKCSNEFGFELEERMLYAKMGFSNEPKRCSVCRGADKAIKSAVKPEKEMYLAVCVECGKETQLPFKPKGDKPVYCKACFAARKKL